MINALPIIQRELLLASRRNGTYWVRCSTAALVGGVLFALALTTNEPAFLISPILFWAVKALTFAYCLFAGVRYTADALSEERREGTLGLLFLTDLRGHDVVLGKLVIRSLNAFLGLVAVIPLLAVPVMMGGVSPGEFWRNTLVMVNTLMFSLAVGLIISAFGVQERNVMLATVITILGVTFGMPLCWESVGKHFGFRWLEQALLFPSPAYALKISASGLFVAVPSDFWPSMLTVAGISVGCVLGAGFGLSRRLQEAGPPSAPKTTRTTLLAARYHHTARARWRDCLDRHPYLWRLRRDRSMAHWSWLLAVVAAVFGLYSLVTLPPAGTRGMEPAVVFGWLAVHWLLKLLLTSEACRSLSEDKRIGALELLLSTPLRPQEVLDAERRHLRRIFVLPIIVVCTANFLIATAIEDRVLSTAFFWGMLLLPADCWALRWTSMQASLESRSLTIAVFTSVWRVLMPPWLALFSLFLLMMATQVSEATLRSFLGLWAVGALIYDAELVSWKRLTLTVGFRRLASGERRFLSLTGT